MGFSLELVKARRRIAELQTKVKKLEAQLAELQQPTKPPIALLSMPGIQVDGEIRALGQQLMYPCLLDYEQDYFYTNAEGWAEVFHYIYTVFDMPTYMAARIDCEDFAILLKGLVSALFGLNYLALAIGTIPQGGHAFDFFRTDTTHLIIEPQTAQCFGWQQRGYEPKYALL